MLNKNQSNKRSIWKYTLILPIVIAFVFLFQIKVVAQVIEDTATKISETKVSLIKIEINKDNTDEDLKSYQKLFLENRGIQLDFSEIERNNKGEIQHIVVKFDDHKGTNGKSVFKGDPYIKAITLMTDTNDKGQNEIKIFDGETTGVISNNDLIEEEKLVSIYNSQFESDTEDNLDRLFIINGKPYTKEDLKGKNIAIIDANIIKLSPKEALKKYGKRAKDGAIIFKGETEIINNVLDADFPAPPPPPPAPPVTRKTTSDINQEKNRFYIINGKEYFQNDLKSYTLKCDGVITYYDEEEAVKKFGEKAKDGAMVFNGVTKLDKNNISKEIQERKTIIFSNDNGDDIVFIPAEKILKLPGYPSTRLNDSGLVLIINGVEKANPLETLNQMNLQNVKSVRVYDESGKETPGTQIKKIVITTK